MSNNAKCPFCGGGPIVDDICEDCGKNVAGKKIPLDTSTSSRMVLTGTVGTGPLGTTGTGRTGSRRQTSRSSTRGSSSRRNRLGGGLISLPPQPSQDPLQLVMKNPEVPERKRRCPACDNKVSRTRGWCPKCGNEFNFEPALKTGDVVNGKFKVEGPIAFGGLGWIYLAFDLVLSRWVVLKGLLNAKDEASAAAAVAERQFLAAVKHPKIVGIYDFVQNGNEGFIVMEYVGGRTIETMRKERTVLPVEEAIAYILGILPAFSYLHSQGFVYCDFKPDNFMLEDDDVKLIDMGGVRKIGDPDGDIYGTRGFMAPEADSDPYEVSDLYTIGRTLALMLMDFKYQTTYEKSLPTPDEQPILAKHESLYRFLLRACHLDPDQRFQNADEMSDQLYGILREIVALDTTPKPAESTVFTADNLRDPEDILGSQQIGVQYLPALKFDPRDPASNELASVAVIDPLKRIAAIEGIVAKFGKKSIEARFRLVDAQIMAGEFGDAWQNLDELAQEDPFDWRVSWYRGKGWLAKGDPNEARNEFGKVYFEMPGEIAPKLAIGYASEKAGYLDEAINYYKRVAKVDPNNTTACFGYARCLQQKGQLTEASQALNMIPANHALFMRSRIALANTLMQDENSLTEQLLNEVAQTIETITADGGVVHHLSAQLFTSALQLIGKGKVKENQAHQLLGKSLQTTALRHAAEASYRQAARYAKTPEEKVTLVDMANLVRPVTVF